MISRSGRGGVTDWVCSWNMADIDDPGKAKLVHHSVHVNVWLWLSK